MWFDTQIGGDIPDFAAEYVKKYGKSNFLKLKVAEMNLDETSSQPLSAKVQDVLNDKNNPNAMCIRCGKDLPA